MDFKTTDEKAVPYFEDDVYPLHTLDYDPNYVDWVMRFNDVLDADMLKKSLSRLLEIGDWRKLGGRVRYRVRDEKIWIHGQRILTITSRMASWKSSFQDHPRDLEKMYLSRTR